MVFLDLGGNVIDAFERSGIVALRAGKHPFRAVYLQEKGRRDGFLGIGFQGGDPTPVQFWRPADPAPNEGGGVDGLGGTGPAPRRGA